MVEVKIPAVALALEHNRNKLAARARTGDVLRVRRGAYCAPDEIQVDGPSGAPREARQKALARARALHSQLRAKHVFSHASAALLLGCLVWTTPRETHVYQRYRASGHAAGDVRRYSWTLAPEDIIEAAGLPVTSLARTVVDCARRCTLSKRSSSPTQPWDWVPNEKSCSRRSALRPAGAGSSRPGW
jgi:predicted transcriptional regulator of viral defense system